MRNKLTLKQKRFCDNYLKSGNATESAKIAGYKLPHPQGCENLQKPAIKEYLDKRLDKLENKAIMDMNEVQEFWARVVRGEETEDGKLARMNDRLKATDLIAKTRGAYLEKIEHSGNVNIRTIDEYIGEISEEEEF